jgi:hypothetical protein
MKRIAFALLFLAACAEPGQVIELAEGDFALIEIQLDG